MSPRPRIKGQRREERQRKEKDAPTGGGFAAMAHRAVVNKGYQGLPRALKPKITIRLPKKGT